MSNKTAKFVKSTKFNGELVKAGTEIEVSDSEHEKLLESGLIENTDTLKQSKATLKLDDKQMKELENKLNEATSKIEEVLKENEFLKRVIALNDMTVKTLNEFAETNKINLDGKTDKDDIVSIIAKSDVEIAATEKTNFLG